MKLLHFDNRFVTTLPGDPLEDLRPRQVLGACWSPVRPTPVAAPRLLAYAPEVAALLGWDADDVAAPEFTQVFAGNALLPGMQPYAACYGGHQFGQWAGQLGDGRAIALGEVLAADGRRWELQLKGAGPTPYARNADGRAVLRSSLREFVCSEAMHHLGVPTTRALSLVATGEAVVRDMFYDGNARPEPGAVVCRVAPSFIRFGNFEIFAARRDLENLTKLVDFTIARDFPELEGEPDVRRAAWFTTVCERTALMVAHWMRVGFVHGVMNSDNMSILGLTIDYGPYGWLEPVDFSWTPNTTDAQGRRYCFGNQPQIAQWNLACLAHALLPLFSDSAPLEQGLEAYATSYNEANRQMTGAKLGLGRLADADLPMVQELFTLMQQTELDMTIWFRALADLDLAAPSLDPMAAAFYNAEARVAHGPALEAWLQGYAARLRASDVSPEQRHTLMLQTNPRFVPRNYLCQLAIDQAEQGDLRPLQRLMEVLRQPYTEQPEHADLAAPRPAWARERAGCAMLSCSS
ncbi:MAG: YdiU family protein [Candidatus Viridilinea halotolerans]|uniref:Protein nucleotidyltransferase YdiU n=1 Tax=Candidatus Viridilinea halotolerans TaxID=2491704 RepID=A0A426TV50_9CHLR|nr:MAG: YdiU family protein [Candidatus Viridilinea halotolerans]